MTVLSLSVGGLDLCLFWPLVSLVASLGLTLGILAAIQLRLGDVTEQTGRVGGLVIFGQVLDAITTLIGIDLLGFTEEVFLSRVIIESTAQLPLTDLLGTTWLFVVVKLAVAVGIVTLVARTEDASRAEQWLLLGVAFVAGFGPGLNNLGLQLQA